MQLPKILIIDDREYDRILYKEYLGESNYEFSELDDGEDVIERLKMFPADIMLLDWQMPRMGGMETLRALNKNVQFKQIPVIIITGLKEDAVLEEAFDYGAIDFINKPIKKSELNARVLNTLQLFEANRVLSKQKDELQELNKIITSQKDEILVSLKLKEEISDLREREHQKEKEEKKRRILSLEMDTIKTRNTLKDIQENLKEAHKLLSHENPSSLVLRRLKAMDRNIDQLTSTESSWEEFKNIFESINPDFFEKLTKLNPKLTPLDFKHCAYIKMNLSNHDISQLINVESKSIQMAHYRIKKKLKITEDKTLREFLISI
jgi:CheY-like chemotaxis protein